MSKIDITSTAVEKGIDTAKGFLDSILKPGAEEVGLLIKDSISAWRFRIQISILNRAKQLCEKHKVSPKSISLKLLVPFLENASLEDNEEMQNKWSTLLSNLVDSEQNITNHVFPYILSQISLTEFNFLDRYVKKHHVKIEYLNEQLNALSSKMKHHQHRTEALQKEIKLKDPYIGMQLDELSTKLNKMLSEVTHMSNEAQNGLPLNKDELKEYELFNLVRLGLIKSSQLPYSYSLDDDPVIDISGSSILKTENLEIRLKLGPSTFFVTELGVLFIKACNEKPLSGEGT